MLPRALARSAKAVLLAHSANRLRLGARRAFGPTLERSAGSNDDSALSSKTFASGALAGGFSQAQLRHWAVGRWRGGDEGDRRGKRRRGAAQEELCDLYDEGDGGLPYADMFHRNVSLSCSDFLRTHPDPSGQLGRAFFGSKHFSLERLVLTPLASFSHVGIPKRFVVGDEFLLWTVAVKAPLELILTWELSRFGLLGCTQLAFDPKLRRVYQGNALDRFPEWVSPGLVRLHERYAGFLLDGMVDELERLSSYDGQ